MPPISSDQIPALVIEALEPALAGRLAARFPKRSAGDLVLSESHYALTNEYRNPEWGWRFQRIRRAVFDWPYKLIHSSDGQHELYDLERDPQESINLATLQTEVVERLTGHLTARLERAETRRKTVSDADTPEVSEPSEAEIEALRELGYLD